MREEEEWEEEKSFRVSPSVAVTGGPSLEDELQQLQPSKEEGGMDGQQKTEKAVDSDSRTAASSQNRPSPNLDDFDIITTDDLNGGGTTLEKRDRGKIGKLEVGRGESSVDQPVTSSLVSPITGEAHYSYRQEAKLIEMAGNHIHVLLASRGRCV